MPQCCGWCTGRDLGVVNMPRQAVTKTMEGQRDSSTCLSTLLVSDTTGRGALHAMHLLLS